MERWQQPNTLLQAARAHRGWSQEKLAEEVGVTGNTVSRWERGEMIPTPYYRTRLCEALGMTAEALGLLVQIPETLSPARQMVVAWADADRKHVLVAKLLRTLEAHRISSVSPWLLGRNGSAEKKKALDVAVRVAPFVVLILSPQASTSRDVRVAAELALLYRRPLIAFWITGNNMQHCLPVEQLPFMMTLDAREIGEQELAQQVVQLVEQIAFLSKEETADALQQNAPAVRVGGQPARNEGAPSVTVDVSDEKGDRDAYLKYLLRRYSSVALPLGPLEGFALQAIFQPLTLRRDPPAAEDLEREQRRPFLGEQSERENEPLIIAKTSEEALQKSPQQRLVILGVPGSGKTTTLQFLTTQQAQRSLTEPDAPLPILVSLPDLARSGKTFGEYLLRLTKETGVAERFAVILRNALEEGRAFLCLDSLDEVPSAQRPEVIRVINEYAAQAGNTWIVGSRFTEYKGGQFRRGQFAEWELQSMSSPLRRELAQCLLPELYRLFRSAEIQAEEHALTFVHLLETHAHTAAWGENPLLFSLAAVVFVHHGALPASQAALYQQVVDAVLATHENDPARRKVLRRVLSSLALHLYQTQGRIFSFEDIVWVLPRLREEQHENWPTEEMVTRIIASGILDVVARETYGFRHQTFQEYLAAEALAQQLVSREQEIRATGWNLAWSKRTFSRWTEILQLMVGILIHRHRKEGARQAQQWLTCLAMQYREPQGDPGDLGVLLALRSLVALSGTGMEYWKEVLGEQTVAVIAQLWIKKLRAEAQHSPPSRTRNVPPLSFDEDIRQMVMEHLLPLLHDEDWRVRKKATYALKSLGGYIPLKVVLAVSHDPREEVRSAGAALLAMVGNALTVECLLNYLGDESKSVRKVTVDTLLYRGEQHAVKQLLLQVQAEDWRVRASKAVILARWGEEVPIEPFLAELRAKEREQCLAAAEVLGCLLERVPLEPLVAALQDKESHVRVATIETLGHLRKRVPHHLLMAALRDKESEVRFAAVRWVRQLHGQLLPEEIEEILASLTQDTDLRVRFMVWQLMGHQDPHMLVEALRSEKRHVRRDALQTIALPGQEAQVPMALLLTALQDEDGEVRSLAARALEKQHERAPLEPLLVALQDEHPHVRASVFCVLWQQGEHRLVEALLTMPEEHAEWMRVIAIGLLGKLGGAAPVEPILEALRDAHANVRAAAAWALRKHGEDMPVEQLLTALQDDQPRVRWAAANAAAYLGERAPIEVLKAASLDENESVRHAALHTLFSLGKYLLPEDMSWSGSFSRYGDWPPEWHISENKRQTQPASQEEPPLGEHSSPDELLKALLSRNWQRRKQAEESLVASAKQGTVELLVHAVEDQASPNREKIVELLGQAGPYAPTELFLSLLQTDIDVQVRIAAARVLGQLGMRTTVSPLVAIFQNEEEHTFVRTAAAQALGRLGEQAPIDLLLAALQHQDVSIREGIIRALAQCGTRVPADVFIQYVGDSDVRVRLAAVEALQRIYPDALVNVATDALAIFHRQKAGPILGSIVHTFIAETIGRFQFVSPVLLEHLTSLLDWPHWETRLKAIQALGQIRRAIPDAAIRRLLELRIDARSPLLRNAADKALAEILSLETGIEDDEEAC